MTLAIGDSHERSLAASAPLEDQLPYLLNPRQYQSQLFEKAKQQNVIAWLGTGSGKTLISVLLLKHVFNEEVARQQAGEAIKSHVERGGSRKGRRISLFLVNRIPLVRQQAQVIIDNSFLRVAELFGDHPLGLDLSQESSWDNLLRHSKYDVVISTAQVILDGLSHGFLQIEEFNLIIFDEAHHAYKLDSYARIMQFHYFNAALEERPRIFGMTASPLNTFGDFNNAMDILERKLDAKIFTASLGLRRELHLLIPCPEEHIIEYERADVMPQGVLTSLISSHCGHLEGVKKVLDRMAFNDIECGPIVSDLAWLGNQDEFQGRIQRKLLQVGTYDSALDLLNKDWVQEEGARLLRQAVDDETELKAKRRYINDAVANSAISEIIRNHSKMPDTLHLTEGNASPKVLRLISVLQSCGSSPSLRNIFCCIIFVKRQQTAVALTELLKRADSLKDWIRPECLIGHNTDYGSGMDPRAQADTLARFGMPGSTNLLVATTVAEEGLDISPCNYVIRFDLFDHHAGYVQSKGRARHPNSLFIMLVEREQEQHFKVMSKLKLVEQDIESYLSRLPREQTAVASLDSDEDESSNTWNEEGHEEPCINSMTTTASLRPLECVSIVCRYVSSLGRDEFSPRKPEFHYIEDEENRQMRVELRLPANAIIRSVLGPWCSSKRKAARLAAFEACHTLYDLGELDEHLLPRKVRKAVEAEEEIACQGDKKVLSLQTSLIPVKRRLSSVYLDGIHRDEVISNFLTLHGLVINTPAAFPTGAARPIMLCFPNAVASMPAVELLMTCIQTIPATECSGVVQLSQGEAKDACRFTYNMLCLIGRCNWKADNKLPFLILPLDDEYSDLDIASEHIDWSEVRSRANLETLSVREAYKDTKPEQKADQLFAEGRGLFSERFWAVQSVKEELDAYSIIPQSVRGETYYDRLCRKRRLSTSATPKPPPSECLWEAVSVPRQGNLLSSLATDTISKHKEQVRLLIPTFLHLVPCSASVYRSCTLLPSLLYHYDAIHLARDLNKGLLQGAVDEMRLVEALTLSSAGLHQNYQRLEFYGDCYLKLIASCYTFAKNDTHREGELSRNRTAFVCNAALRKISLAMDLAEYATARELALKTWRPPFMMREGDEQEEDKPGFSHKVLADLVESVLGAAWSSTSDPLDLTRANTCASRLGVLGPDVDVSLVTFREIYEEQVKGKEIDESWCQRVELGTLSRLQEELRYTFTSPHLALEAVTHASLLCSNLPSYERLEFLGDAVLDFFVVSLFRQKFPHLDPGEMTAIKGNAVSNASLAILCIDLGLQRFVRHDNKSFSERVTAYKEEAHSAREEARKNAQGGNVAPYWLTLQPPKILADIVESVLGAVFVDSGFDLVATQDFFNSKYMPHFDTYFRPEVLIVRTHYDLMQIVRVLRCQEWRLAVEDLKGDRLSCSLIFHGLVIARRIKKSTEARRTQLWQYKEELDAVRRMVPREKDEEGVARQRDMAEYINGASLKAMLQYCLPGDYIRGSDRVSEGEDDVDRKAQNRYQNLHSLCQCWRPSGINSMTEGSPNDV